MGQPYFRSLLLPNTVDSFRLIALTEGRRNENCTRHIPAKVAVHCYGGHLPLVK